MSRLRFQLLVLAALAAAGTARAAPSPGPAPTTAPTARPAGWSAAANRVDDADLGSLSGGQGVAAINEQQLKAMNSGNEVNAQSVTNGAANVNLSGFSGLGNFVVNTGNNNNLQGTMSVNITLAPSP